MNYQFPRLVRRHARVLFATVVAISIAASTMLAQFGAFDTQFEGQLWGVRQELPSDGGYPVGSVFAGGTLFVADQGLQQIVAYNSTTWAPVDVSGGDWNDTTTVGAPAFGLVANEMIKATVNGADAILISDLAQPRVLAFDTTGAHLFTMRLQNPNATVDDTNPLVNGIAMGPGASFTFASGQLSLTGSLAVGWTNEGRTKGVALAYKDVTFTENAGEYSAATAAVLNGTEGAGVGPVSFEVYGVAFDAAGNLYTVDTLTERINVYDSTNGFAHRFRFGTPATDNGVEEFGQPYGLMFWPDANGGRLFVADALNNRVAVFRPNIAGNTLDFLTSIDRMTPAVDPQPFSMSVDPATATLAVSDFNTPSVWILRTADLVAYDLQVLDNGGTPTDTVCAGSPYQVRFSITVPTGHPDAADVLPLLSVDGTAVTGVTPVPADTYPATPMQAGQVVTYTFPLTMASNAAGDVDFEASASSASTTDVLSTSGLVTVSDCPANNTAPTITTSQTPAEQVSGWTPIYGAQTASLTLTVNDDQAVQRVEYRITGTNDTGNSIPPVIFAGTNATESVTIPLPETGESFIEYRARDNNNVWSAWQSKSVHIVTVTNRQSNEGEQTTFTVGQSVGSGYQFSATNLPPGVAIDQNTGQISGQMLFDAAGVYNVTLTETLGAQTSSISFTWTVLNVNRHPTITPLDPGALPPVVEGVPITPIPVVGHDPDGDTVFWTMYGRSIPLGYDLPPTVVINPLTGLITGEFPLDSERAYTLTIGLSECAATPNDDPVVCAGALPRTGLATLYEITVNVANTNQPPDVIDPGNKFNAEGDVITPLQIVASDPDVADGDDVDFEAENLPPGLSIDAETGLITGTVSYTAGPQVYAVVIRARDTVAAHPLPFETFNWTITDAPPTITALPDRTDYEGDVMSLSVIASDPGGAPVTFSATGLPNGLTINPTTGVITGTIAYDAAGLHVVTITVTKGGVSRTDSFNWTVLERNSQPTISAPDRINAEGEVIAPVMVATATDPEGDVLTYSATGLPPGLVMLPNGLVSGTISPTGEGVYSVTVSVQDSPQATPISTTFRWTVTGVNRPPTITSVDQFSNENETVSYVVSGTDPDGDTLTYTMAGTLPATHSINPNTGAITGTFSYNSAGVYTVTVTTTDGQYTASTTFLWTVRNINRPPVIDAENRLNMEGDSPTYQPIASDPDGDTLTWTINGLPPGLSMSSTGVITGTLPLNSAGVYTVSVGVCDAALCAVKTFTWTVVKLNRPPVVTHPDRTNVEGDVVIYASTGSDPDGDVITYSAIGLPAGIVINPLTGTLTGALGYNSAGTYTPTITVSDGSLTGSHTFTWVVTNTNRPPDAVNDVATVNQGSAVTITVLNLDSDPDNDPLAVTAITQPPTGEGSAVLNANGTVTYTAPSTFAGTTTFTYTISDGKGGTDTATVTITVVNVNFPPVVTHPNRTNVEGDTVTYATTASDPDGDTLSFTVTGLPAGISINPATGTLTGTLGYNTAGTYTPTITVSDGSRTASHTFTWVVTNTNRPPDAVDDTATTTQGGSVNITVLTGDSDPDGDTLTVTAITQPASGQGTAVLNANGTVTYTAPANFVGTTTFTYTISDGKGGTDTATVTVTVAALPPSCNLVGYTTYSQGGWGGSGAPALLMTSKFSQVYPLGYVIVGGTKTLKFTSAAAITAFLPQGGTASVLTSSAVNPTSSSAGVLGGQLLALQLAVDYSNAGVLKSGLGNLVMMSGPLAGQTVNQILATANAVMGGNTSALPSGMTISTLSSILESLNLNFHEGTVNNGLLGCPTQNTCVTGTFTLTGNSSTSGTAGNIRTFTANNVNVKVSAFSRTKSTGAWATAFLGAYGPGIGVTDGSEGSGTGDTHMVDNVGDRNNYVLFEFSQPVVVTRAYLDYVGLDSDTTVWIGTTSDPYNNHLTLSDSLLASLSSPQDGTTTSGDARWAVFNGAQVSGNVLVIAAHTTGSDDSFKLGKLEFNSCNSTPSTCVATTVVTNGNSSTSGTAGNVRSYTSGDVSVKVSAFARAKSNGAWTTSFLGAFAPGLGVTDGSEGSGADDSHKVDNVGDRVNYVLYEFSKSVTVSKAYLDYISTDADITVWVGTKTDPFNNHQTLSDAFLSGLTMTEAIDSDSTTTRWVEFNGGDVSGNILVIAARPSGTNDAFKLGKLQFEACGSVSANQAPTVSVSDRSDYKKVAASIQVTGADANNDMLTYTATGLPAGTSMSTSGLITGTPTTIGTYTVTVTVKDPSNATGTDTFVWTILNHAPTVTTENLTANVGQSGTVQLYGSDLDNDVLTYSATGLPAGVTLSSSGLFSGTLNVAGVFTVTVTVKDTDNATGTSVFTLTVVQANRAPVAADDSISTKKNTALNISVLANDSDPDGDSLTVSIGSCSNGSISLNSNGSIRFTPARNYRGTTTFSYTVSDGKGGTDTATVTVRVN